MGLIASVRGLTAPVAGLIGAAAVCIACTSSTSGAPATTAGGGANSTPIATPTVSLPVSGIPSLSGLPSIGGDQANSAFCKDLKNGDLAGLGSTSDPSKALAVWDKITADAPAEIKSDAQAVDDYLHGLLSGSVSASDAQKLSTAAQHIGAYIAGHCAG